MSKALPCFCCGKELDNAWDDGEENSEINQPMDAANFRSYGHYGSDFDPMDGSYLELNICDECLTRVALETSRIVYVQRSEKRGVWKGIIS